MRADNNKLQDLPNKVSMHKQVNKKGKIIVGEKHYDHFPQVWHKVTRFIEHSIGKNFDTVYSKFCNNFIPKLDDRHKALDCFLFHFRHTSYSDGKYVTNFENTYSARYGIVYYIDENGKIAKKDNRRKKDKKFWVGNVSIKKADYDKNDWKQVLAELKDQSKKIDREQKQQDELRKQYLLEWVEFNRKKNNPDV